MTEKTMKKVSPTTVRLTMAEREWLTRQADTHPRGQTGVISDALSHYRAVLSARESSLFEAIVAGNANGA